ncbi:MAG: hypothetical protein KYX67_15470 [Brevundimonas sp.]|uniref:hypothetical protein n=1 Tax=Brevundimonas sp. TaxID=1871086 RepID=UPI00256342EB|nr:hypothetical protein [Brevundimonas sp.]MDK2748716.1 hypothetical protein [Brevundimonas sp.]
MSVREPNFPDGSAIYDVTGCHEDAVADMKRAAYPGDPISLDGDESHAAPILQVHLA